ncbi:hypothetical protein [[Limnothrix rosea] IAM M-220]|uniref:hypothetical protein n=1 Tax=[Limnothrix rosea] IAM M-220 TaxID=454133 RepID=UPI000963FDD8|nr:hypothetical protein [[Limnothrix rosea] IAM M-220]OKH19813.1 hypothetical protein NIES208_01435 [[Limnothrix rosea] IAM M-220]
MKNYDLTILNNLSVESLCFYLKQTGWEKIKEREGVASLWKRESENAVIVPLDPSYDDYIDRLWQVFQALEKIEKRALRD